jgi:hypothetical protein
MNHFPRRLLKTDKYTGLWWFFPVVLTTWNAEIRRIAVLGQPRQNNNLRPHIKGKNLGGEACFCHPNEVGKIEIGGSLSRPDSAKSKTLCPI